EFSLIREHLKIEQKLDQIQLNLSKNLFLRAFIPKNVKNKNKFMMHILDIYHELILSQCTNECVDIMVETTNSETVVSYYNAAVSYGVPTVKAAAKRLLEVNLLGYGWRHPFEGNFARLDDRIALRMKYLLLHEQDDKILYSDNLRPPDWLHGAYREQWLHLLRVDGNKDRGPAQMTEKEFSKECFRCGRCVEKPSEYIWRWKAFHYGLDLLMTLDTTSLRIKRNHRLDFCLFLLNEQRQVKHVQDSRMLRLCLRRNTEHEIMTLDKQLCYPLYVSVNMQLVTPLTLGEEDTTTDLNFYFGHHYQRTQEFNFVKFADKYSTGSSLMPQKRNPDCMELIRGKTGTILGKCTGFMITLKGIPSTYNKDLQEDKEILFYTYDTLYQMFHIAEKALSTLKINREDCKNALTSDMLATDMAYYLVTKG
ncbi:Protein germ cell-less, partial [Temnothorax longispinosus]